MRRYPRMLFMAAGSLLGCGLLQANLISNGSFETPVVPVGGFTNYLSGSTSITGWTVVGPEASVVSSTFSQNGTLFPAEDANQWVDLTGFTPTPSRVCSRRSPRLRERSTRCHSGLET
jgi:hypothetical protein